MSLASTAVSLAALVSSAGARTKGTSKRKGLLWPAVDEGIPSIMVEKHGSKSMGILVTLHQAVRKQGDKS